MNLDDQRVRPQHLERAALVYARQSSPEQVRLHTESARVQRGLVEVARSLGWRKITVIDDDLGVSAAGFSERPGFQRMLTLVATRRAGVLLCVDASRLSRNSPDWAQLFQLCGHFDTLVVDFAQIYDLALPNDRLVLGIRSVISEMELTIMRQRMRTGVESKAARGEYRFMLPAGYVYDHAGRIVLDPDRRVAEAIRDVFRRFELASSVRQLTIHYQDTHGRLPVRRPGSQDTISWVEPRYRTVHGILSNPMFAGAYVWGRSRTRVDYVDGCLQKRNTTRLPIEQARVFIKDHHPAYISWQQYEVNQAKIVANRARTTMADTRGAVREGNALLVGVLRCGHCGRRLRVAYSGRCAVYYCPKGAGRSSRGCLRLGSGGLDRVVSEQLCQALQPLALQAAVKAEGLRERDHEASVEQTRLCVQAAQYEADRALEQYDQVDPKNRLVADTLEQRLDERLQELRSAQERLEAQLASFAPLTPAERERLTELAERFPETWNHPSAGVSLRKQILRAAIVEAVLTHQPERERVEVVIHWQGGAHTRCYVHKRVSLRGAKARPELVEAVRHLARGMDDGAIARVLNLNGATTPRGLRWTQDRVLQFRRRHRIRLADGDDNVLTGKQAARYLGIAWAQLEALVQRGLLNKNQLMPYAPWRIRKDELDSPPVRAAIERLQNKEPLWGAEVSSQQDLPFSQ